MKPSERLGLGLILAVGVAATLVPGCGDDEKEPVTEAPAPSCDAGDASWVRQALLALNGRRPQSQAEVRAYVDVLSALREEGMTDVEARRTVAMAVTAERGSYRERWSDFLMDTLSVFRSPFIATAEWDTVQAKSCYGPELFDATDGGNLAAWVRDNSPLSKDPPNEKFKMSRLLSSTLYLDDLTPLLRAQLFQLMIFPLPGANVAEDDLELARRNSFGASFEDAFLGRDVTCLPCHNSEASVTTTFPLQGTFERALYGSPDGGNDTGVFRSVFRVRDVLVIPERAFGSDVGEGPWGWDPQDCRGFAAPTTGDPLGTETHFGSIEGSDASVWRLEVALRNGFERLRGVGLQVGATGEVEPDDALAYMVASSIVGRVWEEVMGWPLTIAHRFPRTEAQRDTLGALTDHFIKEGYSLRSLLAEIVTNPTFNYPASGQDERCDEALAPVLNPWSIDDPNEDLQGNFIGDRVFPLSTRLLRRSLHASMGWRPAKDFPTTVEEEARDNAIGLFTSPSKRGFRGLGFQAMLTWEAMYGSCPIDGDADFITALVANAQTRTDATLQDAVIALKDRLVSEPSVDPVEVAPLEEILGRPLSTALSAVPAADLDAGMRQVCGAVVAQPQFLLGGVVPADAEVPTLTLPEHAYAATCALVSENFERFGSGTVVECQGDSLVVHLP